MTTRFLFHITITLLGYFLLATSYIGLGWGVSRIMKFEFSKEGRLFVYLWLGWAVTLFILQVQHLFTPITFSTTSYLFALGVIFSIVFLIREFQAKRKPTLRRDFYLTFLLFLTWVAVLSLRTPTNYDTGLYHLNIIRWYNQSPIVLGLGNLHGRLAFNNSIFLYVAQLNLYPYFKHGYNLANSFLVVILMGECLYYFFNHLTKDQRNKNNTTSIFVTISFILPILYFAKTESLSSVTADTTSFLLQILLFFHFVRYVETTANTKKSSSNSNFIYILSATAITVKLSNLFFAALICIIVFIINLKTQNKPLKQRITYYSKAIALPLFIIIIWILRGILFSGCPAYPSTFGCIDLDWAIPLNYVESELDWILSYARNPNLYPNQVLNSWAWLKPWFESSIAPKKISIMYPMLVSILGVIATTFVAFRNSSFSRISKVILLPLPIIGGLLQWFFTAPSPRFVIALFWILPLAILIILLRFLEIQGKRKNGTLIIFSLILNASIAWNLFQDPLFFTRISITQGYEPLPVADLSIQQTDSGLDIWIPKESDQCWNSILPCTPYFKRDLTYINHELFPKFAIQKDVGK